MHPAGRLLFAVLAAPMLSASEPVTGVSATPCETVPIAPTVAHQASANAYESWMRDWLRMDWGQLCRYQHDNAALPPASHNRVIFLGDSITEGWQQSDPKFFTGDRLDRGISGQTTAQMLVRFRADVLLLHPAVVQIMAGTNDIAGNTGPTSLVRIQGNMASMAEQARAHGIAVIIASIPPAAKIPWQEQIQPKSAISAMNEWLRQYATREHLWYADYYAVLADGNGGMRAAFSEDGVHPNAAGYAAMRPVAEAAIRHALAHQSR